MNESELDLSARVKIPSHVVYREFPAETVILNLETGQYHGLNRTGGAILASLQRTTTVQETVTAVATDLRGSAVSATGFPLVHKVAVRPVPLFT